MAIFDYEPVFLQKTQTPVKTETKPDAETKKTAEPKDETPDATVNTGVKTQPSSASIDSTMPSTNEKRKNKKKVEKMESIKEKKPKKHKKDKKSKKH